MTTLETLLNDPDAVGAWTVAPDHSAVRFTIKNMWGLFAVKGKFTEFSGRGELSDDGAVSGHLEIDVASLRTGVGPRDKHLLSADFFDADRCPEIRVVVTALHPLKGRHAELRANFTIKSITDPVPMRVAVTDFEDGSVRISGEAEIDRTQFGLGWNKLGIIAATATASAELVFVKAS
ncbi:YceI family protein [Mycobacterium simiae]|uniref:YceI family protein n=1 Tax=Mycobacterium simiae TaxID=1784 RepID=A0A5B1BT98_MYCSI|nr:YceI family protein [Mycobacterium simiae]KAA1251172.1 YceI family protein [Mycobacterium simiae]